MIHFFLSSDEFPEKSRETQDNQLFSKDAAGCPPLYPLTPKIFLSKGRVGKRDRHMHRFGFVSGELERLNKVEWCDSIPCPFLVTWCFRTCFPIQQEVVQWCN